MSVPEFDLLAASLRADTVDLKAFVEALAEKLADSFPEKVKVERRGGLLGGHKRVHQVELNLGDHRYELANADGRIDCRRKTVVRGVALKTDELSVDEWIDALSQELVTEAGESERGRLALEKLLGA